MSFDLINLSGDLEETAAEVWLPSRNETEAGAVSQFISSLPENISLEYFARGSKRAMLVRGSLPDVKTTGSLITATYPSASLHILDKDPAADVPENSITLTGEYGFSGEGYLPLKCFSRYRDYDPVHTILAGLLDLGSDECVSVRISLKERHRPDWLDTVLKRIKAEKQRGFVTNAAMEETGNSIGAYTPVEQYRTVDLKKASVTVLMMSAWAFVLFLFLMGMTGTMFIFLAISLLLTFIRAKMPDQIDETLKEQRRDDLMRLQEQISLELMNQKIGRELQVLIDGYRPEEDVYIGRTRMDAPDVDGFFYVKTEETLNSGDLIIARVQTANAYDLYGEMIKRYESAE